VEDVETGQKRLIDTSDVTIRTQYASFFESNKERFQKDFALAKSDTISISTEEDYIKAMQVFFKRRSKR
jgi:uncharacterized protein YacL (UPF0231 family)